MARYLGSRVLVLAVFAVLTMLMFALGACQNVGPAFEQTREGVTTSDVNPNRLAYSDSEGQETAQSAGPVQRTTIDPDGTIQAMGGGVPSRELALAGKFYLRSGSDVEARAEKVYDGAGGLLAEGLVIKTSTSEPQRAANEALAQWVAALQAVTPEQRLALEAQVRGWVDGANAVVPTIGDVLKQLLLPGVP